MRSKQRRFKFLARWVRAAVAVVALANAARAQIPKPVDDVLVVDANNQPLGRAIGASGPAGATVALDIGGRLVLVGVNRLEISGTYGETKTNLVFESSDCTGQAYTPAGQLSTPFSLDAVVVTNPNGTVYVGDPSAVWVTVTMRSQYLSDRNGTGRCDDGLQPQQVDSLVPVAKLVDLYDFFTPPFSLVAAPTPTTTNPSATPTATSPPEPTVTATHTASAPSVTPTKPAAAACCGDCDGSGAVTVDEVITGVNHVLFGCPP